MATVDQFIEAELGAEAVLKMLRNDEITHAEYTDELNALRVKHEGLWWQFNPETTEWMKLVGNSWVVENSPFATPSAPPPPPVPPPVTSAPVVPTATPTTVATPLRPSWSRIVVQSLFWLAVLAAIGFAYLAISAAPGWVLASGVATFCSFTLRDWKFRRALWWSIVLMITVFILNIAVGSGLLQSIGTVINFRAHEAATSVINVLPTATPTLGTCVSSGDCTRTPTLYPTDTPMPTFTSTVTWTPGPPTATSTITPWGPPDCADQKTTQSGGKTYVTGVFYKAEWNDRLNSWDCLYRVITPVDIGAPGILLTLTALPQSP